MLLSPTLSAREVSPRGGKRQGQVDGRHQEAGVRVSSADWFKAGVARQRVGPISLGIAPARVRF